MLYVYSLQCDNRNKYIICMSLWSRYVSLILTQPEDVQLLLKDLYDNVVYKKDIETEQVSSDYSCLLNSFNQFREEMDTVKKENV